MSEMQLSSPPEAALGLRPFDPEDPPLGRWWLARHHY